MATEKKADKQHSGFEKSLERLEAIVSEMEDGKLGLETMMKHFEEGMQLIKACSNKLNEVERRIEILVQKGDGAVVEPFKPGDEIDRDGASRQ